MVISQLIRDCDMCGCRNTLHRVHEAFFGRLAQEDCVVCANQEAIEQEWPELVWQDDPHCTFVVKTKKQA